MTLDEKAEHTSLVNRIEKVQHMLQERLDDMVLINKQTELLTNELDRLCRRKIELEGSLSANA